MRRWQNIIMNIIIPREVGVLNQHTATAIWLRLNAGFNYQRFVCLSACGQPGILPHSMIPKIPQGYPRFLKVTQGYQRLPKVPQGSVPWACMQFRNSLSEQLTRTSQCLFIFTILPGRNHHIQTNGGREGFKDMTWGKEGVYFDL